MRNPTPWMAFTICLLLALPASAQIRIGLRPHAAVDSTEVRLGDIAEVRGAAPRTISQLEQLNVGTFKPEMDHLTLRRSLVKIHLQLAGWSTRDFQLSGATTVEIQRREPEPLSDMTIEAAAIHTMRTTLNISEDEIRVRLKSPFTESLPGTLKRAQDLTVKVLPPLNSRIGSLSLTVQLWRGSRLVLARAGRFDVLRRHQVVVTRTSLPRSHTITERDVQSEVRYLATPADQFEMTQIVGRQVRSTVAAGSLIELRHLQPVQQPKRRQIVRARDNVQVTAVNGRLKVQLTAAQALDSGRQGDTIRVRNTKSNEVLSGRITAPGHVEIRL